jgi:hypothetical protein
MAMFLVPNKHIRAKYLYVHWFHNTGDLTLQYCPTDQMWADILTKPLQGSKFHLYRAFLMNCPENYNEKPPFVPHPILQPISTYLLMKPQISRIPPLLWECVFAKPMSVKIHSQDRELIPIPYNTTEKKVSAGVTLYFHIVLCQPSILLAWIL